VTLTYFFCIRPMRHGRWAMGGRPSDDQTAADLELARTQLALLRLQQEQRQQPPSER
jgi:hypothetical protein